MTAADPLVTTGFDADTTAAEVVSGTDLSGSRAVVTGASSGIGIEIAGALLGAGAEVVLAVRDPALGRRVAADLRQRTGSRQVLVEELDLARSPSVARFAERWRGPLHLLVNNAGTLPSALQRTSEGWEMQFAVNHLGHFALSLGLHGALAAGAHDRGGARIVSLTSGAHQRSPVVFDDLHFERRAYDPQSAYAQSKTADALFVVEATRRWASDGIVANAANPGGVATGLQRDFSQQHREYLARAEAEGAFTWRTVEQGAATPLVAAVAAQFAATGGHYLSECNEARTVPDGADPLEDGNAVKRWAKDPDQARRLWDTSLELVRL